MHRVSFQIPNKERLTTNTAMRMDLKALVEEADLVALAVEQVALTLTIY